MTKNKKWMLAGALTFLVTISAVAQTTTEAPKAEITGEYSYFRFNPNLSGLESRNLNGGGVDASYYFLPMIGFKAELLIYGSTTFTTIIPTTLVTFKGTIPAGTYNTNGSLQTYLFGPIVKARYKRFEPFGQALFGVARLDVYGNLTKAIAAAPGATLKVQGTQTPFAMSVGGGLDIPVTKLIAVRVADVDYVLTRLANPFTASDSNQSHFKYSAGVQFRFGGAK